jgi:hypothetical protein
MLTHRDRGSALLTVLIVLLVVTLLSVGSMVMSGKHLSNAKARESSVGLSNCAHSVRQYLGAQITSGVGVPSLSFSVPGTTAAIKLEGGHYDAINVNSFKLAAPAGFGAQGGTSVENLANALPLTLGKTATPTTGTAVCTDASGRTYEVEFSFISG